MTKKPRARLDRTVTPPAMGATDSLPEGTSQSASGAGRRRLFSWLWGIFGAVAVGELGWITLSFLRPRRSAAGGSGGTIMSAGPVARFAPGSVTAFPAGRFYLVRLADGGFLALHRECTHLGCTVPWDAKHERFLCPCHASSFDATGEVLGPPAPRPLDLLEVRIENGIVKVDTGRRLRRDRFDPSQVVRS